MANRLRGRFGYPADAPFKPTFHKTKLWDTFPKKPSKVFVSSMGDLFAECIPTEWIVRVLDVVRINYKHTFIFLTKNPKRYSEFDFPKNAWIGYSTTGPLYHKWDLRHKDNIKFISIEPMMAPLTNIVYLHDTDLIIVGRETGNRKERVVPESRWILEVIKNCERVGIKLFLKDNLNYQPKIQDLPI